jgi:hypothetical protein
VSCQGGRILNHQCSEFCDRWLEKAGHYDGQDLSNRFDKFFTLFVVYNALYVETAVYLHRKAKNEGRNDYKLEGDSFPDQAAATKYVLDFLTSRSLMDKLEGDGECAQAISSLTELMEQKAFHIRLDPVWGKPLTNKDQELLASLKSDRRDEKASALLMLIYSVRCNLVHGRKDFSQHQDELLRPCILVLDRVINLLYQKLRSVPDTTDPRVLQPPPNTAS